MKFKKGSPMVRFYTPLLIGLTILLTNIHAQSVQGSKREITSGETTASLIEEEENYIVRLNLPGRTLQTVHVSLEGDRLHVEAPPEGKLGRYEQDLTLDAAASDRNPHIDRREWEKTIVVVIPKSSDPTRLIPQSTAGNIHPGPDPFDELTRAMSQQMARLQQQMTRMMGESFPDPGGFLEPAENLFPGAYVPKVHVQEEKDRYIVAASLPSPHMGKINVSIKDQTLTIKAKGEETQPGKVNSDYFSEQAEYSQSMELPGPVEIGRMKVDRKGSTLFITLPKANS